MATPVSSMRAGDWQSASKVAAVVEEWGKPPKLLDIPNPIAGDSHPDHIRVQVYAACVHSLVRARALGKHYSSTSLPHCVGVDGVGSLADGRKVYFTTYENSTGSFSQVVEVPVKNAYELSGTADPLQVAALVNPAMSSWMAIRRRVIALPPQFSVLVLGATSMSGRLAITIVRSLGAGKVFGCARNEAALQQLDLNDTVTLQKEVSANELKKLGHIDIVLDYLYGEPAITIMKNLHIIRQTQWIQIGSIAGQTASLPAAVMKGRNLIMIGAGLGSWSLGDLHQELPDLLQVVKDLPKQKLNVQSMNDITKEWTTSSGDRTVFVF